MNDKNDLTPTADLERVLRLLDTLDELSAHNTKMAGEEWRPEDLVKGYHLERIRRTCEGAIRALRSQETPAGGTGAEC